MDIHSFVKELVTSDDIPDVLGPWEPVSNRKKDKLYQKRLKQNPDLKKNIKKIGENLMKTVITFKSKNQRTISSQWHKMYTMNHTGSISWTLSNPEVEKGSYSFTLEYTGKDQYLEGDRLKNLIYAGVDYTVSQTKNEEVEQQEAIVALIESGDDASLLADILLKEEIEITESNQPLEEAEVPDDKDGESDTIDDVQSMLTKMLPKTKGLKLDKEKEEKIKSHLKSAMSLMGEEVEDVKKPESGMTDIEESEAKPDYPQFQFALMLPREDYTAAMRTLNNSNVKAKTKFNAQKDKMAVIGFDKHNGTGEGKPEFTKDEVIDILKNAGIAATSATGIEMQKEPETLEV